MSYELAIDFGSSAIRIAAKNKGVLANEPAVVAINKKDGKMLGAGLRAKAMTDRAHSGIAVIWPISGGRIHDILAAQLLVRSILDTAAKPHIKKPSVLISLPCAATEMEKKALFNTALAAGAKRVAFIPSPVAAALGNGINITNATARTIVDIGAQTTEIAVVTQGTVAVYDEIFCAGNVFDKKIADYMRAKYGLLIGRPTAEMLKLSAGCIEARTTEVFFDVKGRSLYTGLPTIVRISSNEIPAVLEKPAVLLSDAIRDLLDCAPAQLKPDIAQYGVLLTGGSTGLYGFNTWIENKCQCKTALSEDAKDCGINGLLKALTQQDTLIKAGIISEQ